MKLFTALRTVPIFAAVALTLIACTPAAPADAPGQAPTPSAHAEELKIVTAFYPLEFLARGVGGERAIVENLTQPGAEPHDLELKPRQVASIHDADLVIYLAGMQPSVDRAIAQAQPAHAIEVSSLIKLQPSTSDGDGHDHSHGDHEHGDHDHAHTGSGDGADLGKQEADPHLWLDPTNMVTIAKSLGYTLAELDPDEAADYRDRAEDLTRRLLELDQRFHDGLHTCETRGFVTSHSAFGYLARRYDLQQIAIRGLKADQEPTPARLAAVQEQATKHKITTIFYETLVSPDVSKSVADDLDLTTDVLDPLEGLSSQSRGGDYLAVMDANLAALRTAGRCA